MPSLLVEVIELAVDCDHRFRLPMPSLIWGEATVSAATWAALRDRLREGEGGRDFFVATVAVEEVVAADTGVGGDETAAAGLLSEGRRLPLATIGGEVEEFEREEGRRLWV